MLEDKAGLNQVVNERSSVCVRKLSFLPDGHIQVYVQHVIHHLVVAAHDQRQEIIDVAGDEYAIQVGVAYAVLIFNPDMGIGNGRMVNDERTVPLLKGYA